MVLVSPGCRSFRMLPAQRRIVEQLQRDQNTIGAACKCLVCVVQITIVSAVKDAQGRLLSGVLCWAIIGLHRSHIWVVCSVEIIVEVAFIRADPSNREKEQDQHMPQIMKKKLVISMLTFGANPVSFATPRSFRTGRETPLHSWCYVGAALPNV